MEELEEVMTKLEELVLEENRIVTFKAFSKYCGIHVLKAKKVMKDFYQKNNEDLSACYIVWGYKYINDEKALLFVLSREKELEKTKASFLEVLDYEIYCLSKTTPKDLSDIYSNEVALRKESTKTVPPRIQDINIKFLEPTRSFTKSETMPNNVAFPKSFEPCKVTKTNQTSVIEKAFAKTIPTSSTKLDSEQDKPEKHGTEAKNSQPKDNKNKAGGAMMAFVKKGVIPSTVKEPPKKEAEPDVKALEKEMWSDSCDEEIEDEPIPEKPKKSVKPVKKMRRIIRACSESEDEEIENSETTKVEEKKLSEISKSKSNARLNSSGQRKECDKNVENKKKSLVKEEKKKKTQSKKRKASESDNESPIPRRKFSTEDDEEDEDIIPPTPAPKIVPKGPCLQYQTVKKTFQDDEGFFVTRKEKCLVEVQSVEKDNEEQNSPAKNEPKTGAKMLNSKKISENKKQKTNPKNSNGIQKKQSSLDLFFHKK